ncbi:MAG TPA: ComEC/Rec2 family competence protein, partial [candidate division Zixibacteria bacterium]|nr:ComEC/Rec2 family competence protein [candidate division Zixibacteria bacterium]
MKYPALITVVCFILGIIVGDNFSVPSFLLLGILLLTLAGSIYLYFKKSKGLDYLLLFCLFLAGFWRYELKTRDFPLNHISNFLDLDKSVQITGQIVADPDVREDKTHLTVATSKFEWDNKSLNVTGNILVKVREATFAFNYGDVVQLQGYLNTPLSRRNPGLFDYQRYLSTKGIYGLVSLNNAEKIKIIENQTGNFFISKIIIPTETFIKKTFEQTLDQPHQALLAGFVLGERRQIPEEIYEMFTKTGTLHLLAVSGFNVGVIVLFLLAIVKLL